MIIVDTHCHAGRSWFEPIELLLYQMEANNVDKAVLIQHRGAYDNSYLLDCAGRFPGRLAVVAMVDTESPDAPAALAGWAARGVNGVRLEPHQHSPGPDPLAIWRKAEELGLVVSCQGTVEQFASTGFADVVAAVPRLTIVIEHLAGATPEVNPPDTLYKTLAEYPNTYIKVPGLGEISERPAVLQPGFALDFTPPLIELVYKAFGPRRMMWGSDYPPVSGREGYRNALHGVMEHPALRNAEDRESVMGKTALAVFDFDKVTHEPAQ